MAYRKTLLVTLLAVVLIVSACGPSATPAPATQAPAAQAPAPTEPPAEPVATTAPAPTEAAPAPTEAPAATAVPAAEPAAKKRLVVGMKELVTSFDAPYDWNIPATWIHSNIGDCVVWRDRKTAEFVPWLAESWENIDDTTWRIKLRENVKFTNGEPMNAEAVKFSIERIQADEKALTHPQWKFISEIKIIDDYTLEVKTGAPEPAFLSKMAGTGCQVVPPKYYQEVGHEGYAQAPIGTGPFKFVEFKKDDRVVLEANPDYFRGKPAIDELVLRSIPEDSTRVAELLTGGTDLIVSVPVQDWSRVEENTDLELSRFLTTQVMELILRGGPSPSMPDFNGITVNPKVRAAIEYAIDRQAIADLLDGMGVPTLTRITPPTLGVNPDLYNKVGEYNPEKAKQLLQEGGYNGEKLTFHSTTANPMQKEVTEAIAAMLQEVGLNVDLNIMDITTFREQVYGPRKNEEIYMDALGNSFFDPWIAVLGDSAARRERTGWQGPEADAADKLIVAAAVNMNPEERAKQYQEIAEKVVAANGGTHVFLYQMKDTLGKKKTVDFTPALDGFLWLGEANINQ